jgi:hypothetical protein
MTLLQLGLYNAHMDIAGERAKGTRLLAANWADALEPLENFSYPAARRKDVELEGRPNRS